MGKKSKGPTRKSVREADKVDTKEGDKKEVQDKKDENDKKKGDKKKDGDKAKNDAQSSKL